MVYYGKQLYFAEKMLPDHAPTDLIGYSSDQYNWTVDNEYQIWSHFIQNDHLFSTDRALDKRFLELAPFSKFGLLLDAESPSRVGRYIGWQIVRAYAEKNPDLELRQLLVTPEEIIYKKSKYKPAQ